MLFLLASVPSLAAPPTVVPEIAPVVRHTQGWERPTLYTGLGIAAVSFAGAVATVAVMDHQCAANGSFECMQILIPATLGTAGVALGGLTATIGAAGLLAAPTSEPGLAIAVRGHF